MKLAEFPASAVQALYDLEDDAGKRCNPLPLLRKFAPAGQKLAWANHGHFGNPRVIMRIAVPGIKPGYLVLFREEV